jgi:hypothetical protein
MTAARNVDVNAPDYWRRRYIELAQGVEMIRGAKNQTLGYLVAPDEKEAIEMAILEHRISDPERQRRPVARPEN